jgi:hypothetical protein
VQIEHCAFNATVYNSAKNRNENNKINFFILHKVSVAKIGSAAGIIFEKLDKKMHVKT